MLQIARARAWLCRGDTYISHAQHSSSHKTSTDESKVNHKRLIRPRKRSAATRHTALQIHSLSSKSPIRHAPLFSVHR